MKFTLKPIDASAIDADLLICYCWEGEVGNISTFPRNLLEEIKEVAQKEKFEGEDEQALFIYPKGLISAYKVLLFGLGKKDEFDLYKLYKSVALSIRKATEGKPAKIALVVDEYWTKKHPVEKITKAIVEAANLSSYQFSKYKGLEEQKKLHSIDEVILSIPAPKISAAERGVNLGGIFSEATIFARDLINEPSEVTSPEFLANVASDIAKVESLVKVKIIEEEEAKKMGMESFLGVARGSDKPPKFIRLSYKAPGASKKIVVIGKGITFDTGGLSLKSAEHMETMKMDMSGAAAVLAIFKVISTLKPKVEVVGLIAACENMPSGRALKPGDILKALNGKTIEVLNTDAEGRLTLADAISYANLREKPDEIIDVATLTGACMVALGTDIAGIWGNDEKMISGIKKSASDVAELVWQLPLFSEYKSLIKSHIADIKNAQAGRYGGAIAAALFLSEFVGKTPWVHLDIAGPAYTEKNTPLSPIGGVGFGVRTLLEYILTK